jgi:outer membrane protein assembly factor BamD
MKQLICVSVMAGLLILSGCAWFDKGKQEKTADELINDGMHDFEQGNYKKASESFQKLKEWYPFSKYSSLAELKMADSFFRMEEYDNAALAYEEFENLHPRNEAVPYVIYQTGLCHFKKMDTVDRDQSNVKKAIDVFNRLVKQFPEDLYSRKADEHIRECQKSLAGHEFYVGVQYYKGRHYKSALSRFRAVISEYPDVGFHQQAIQYIGLCEEALNRK